MRDKKSRSPGSPTTASLTAAIIIIVCGRYTLTDPGSVPSFFEISQTRIPLRYNIAPGQIVPVILGNADGKRQLVEMEWGISGRQLGLSSKSKRLINVRSETAGQKKIFRPAFRNRRCLVPASGFYEWKKKEKQRLPYYFYPSDEPLLGFAGIWELRQNGDPPVFAILTCPANSAVASIHNRMPVTLQKEYFSGWLEPKTEERELSEMLLPLPSEQLAWHPVSTLVNNPRNNQEDCIRPVRESLPDYGP